MDTEQKIGLTGLILVLITLCTWGVYGVGVLTLIYFPTCVLFAVVMEIRENSFKQACQRANAMQEDHLHVTINSNKENN